MKVRDLPGFDPHSADPNRDVDLDYLEPDAEVLLTMFTCVDDYAPHSPEKVNALIAALRDDPGAAPPVVILAPEPHRGQHPLDLVTGAHRLTAVYVLGWPAYPAYEVQGHAYWHEG